MDKTYNPAALEQRWYKIWEDKGYFAPSQSPGPAYCIMIPPPNVTGSLHMGHAFQDTIMDALTRYHRMRGENTLWQAGTDHAGIATQMVVERQLAATGQSRHDLGRDAFIARIWNWKAESGGNITRQLRRLGASLDWSRERFTMDPALTEAVREVFVRLYEEKLIYRGKRLVNWDPVLRTAVSDLEVVPCEEDGSMWHIRYPIADSESSLVVATTRPETMLGDAAVAVHPDDERYRHLIGSFVILPVANRRIPIIADEYVDPAFGTGCVKITPAHDFNDYAVWQRHRHSPAIAQQHGQGLINIFTADARIKAQASDDQMMATGDTGAQTQAAFTFELIPPALRGLDRFAARKALVTELESQGFLVRVEKHKLTIPRGDRTQAVIEPLLTDQWFVRAAPLAEPAIRAVADGRIRFVPENWVNTYNEWMRNIQDWCISRQIWWGHRIPAWYDTHGNVYVGRSEEDVRRTHKLSSEIVLTQDADVLDTWFSSALWPFSTLGWPAATPELATFYPTNVLVTGFDIIFFWVARMIMMGLKFTGDVPFREVYIHGLVRDAHGQKMSKSKGNVLDPIDLIDGIDLDTLVAKRTTGLMQPSMAPAIDKATRKEFPSGIPPYGTDALRFTFAALASTGRDIRFDLGRIEGYRNFCNKLWNAARYVLMNTEGQDNGLGEAPLEYSLADRWIRTRLQQTIREVNQHFQTYRFDLAANAIYDFTWNEYCDWYLELSKPILSADHLSPATKRGTRRTLITVLETLLRVAHPIVPFISEEIWQRVKVLADVQGDTIMLQPYPQVEPEAIDERAVKDLEWVQSFVLAVRKIRGEMNIAPSKPLPVLVQNWSDADRTRFENHGIFVTTLARLNNVTWVSADAATPESATSLSGTMTVLIPIAGLIDKNEEITRLGKEIQKLRIEAQRNQTKLANPNFADKAPAPVVEKERQRGREIHDAIAKLEHQLERIHKL